MRDVQGARATVSRGAMRFSVRGGSLVLGLLTCGLAAAQDAAWKVHPALQDMWTLQLTAFGPSVSTTASLNSAAGRIGTTVSLEDDLGFNDRKTMGAFFAGVRLADRWKIEAEYFALDRSNSRAISRTINWGEHTFPVNTVVGGNFESSVFRLSGGYSFLKDERSELGVALGLFTTDFSASLSASGVGAQGGDVLAPLPAIGLYGAYALSPRWLLSGRIDFFSLSYGDYDGSLLNVVAGVDYRFARNFGVGAGYRYTDYDLTVTKSKYNGALNYRFSGPTLYVTASF